MPQISLTDAAGDCVIAAQMRYQANTLKANTASFASAVRTNVQDATGVAINNWCIVIAAASAKMTLTSGTLIEANAMGLLLYRCLSLAAALPTGVSGSISLADKVAILAAYNAHLTSV